MCLIPNFLYCNKETLCLLSLKCFLLITAKKKYGKWNFYTAHAVLSGGKDALWLLTTLKGDKNYFLHRSNGFDIHNNKASPLETMKMQIETLEKSKQPELLLWEAEYAS